MKRAVIQCVTVLRRYQSLIVWGICASLVLMTFFQKYFPRRDWLLLILMIGIFLNFYFSSKNSKNYPLPEKFSAFAVAVLILSAAFDFFNFFFYLAETEGGSPELVDGAFALVNYDGKGTKFITETEYHHLMCLEQRFWCGHTLVFCAAAMFTHFKQKNGQTKPEKQKKKEPQFDFIMQPRLNPLLPKSKRGANREKGD